MENSSITIYVKMDENNSLIGLQSSIFLEDMNGWNLVDEWKEGEDRYMYAHADNGEYLQLKHGKPLYDELGRPNYHDDFLLWTDEEKEQLYPVITNEEQANELEELKQRQEMVEQALQDAILMMMG